MKLRHTLTLALLAAPAFAIAAPAPATDTMQVSLDLTNRCTVEVDDLNFGVHNTLASDLETKSEFRVRCTGISPSLLLNFSAGGSGNAMDRQMTDGAGNSIRYTLSTIQGWGQVTNHGFYGFGQNLTWPLFAKIPGGQNPKASGTYADNLVATVTF
ncbi:spore coat protein U domain-containing protein [Cognatilysobacter lacus]|uniref:Spore coat protein U domain-containing protein n=1 Tax=Cognatilysobacter lacus TaxID=1643323 RepID=A0A5D8Z7R8_9GAMM|nr:spore coat protein U domain-containing protein [Lysobacter lacus]TZF90975.1 spore coat protein U domain-containing protein [Lysobacter lacus]